ncbi:MAG: ComEA family DNA-binding protein [Lachnospiraceae bacterium]|jgi:competence protein ComEA|nr:ComEA family DNA-binding protein [Lachnospiraceae bacterium]
MRKMMKYVAILILTAWTVCGCGAQSDLVMVASPDADRTEETALYTKEQVKDQAGETEAKDVSQTERSAEGENVRSSETEEAVQNSTDTEPVQDKEDTICYVHVCGAVVSPGVYRMERGARIFEAIELAGGVTEDAYGDAVNQALEVKDGDRIRIPTQEEWQSGMADLTVRQEEKDNEEQDTAESFTEDKININTADVSVLCTLPGIGMAKAEAIVAYRESNGKFTDISQIQNVTGIKEGLYHKIKDRIKI